MLLIDFYSLALKGFIYYYRKSITVPFYTLSYSNNNEKCFERSNIFINTFLEIISWPLEPISLKKIDNYHGSFCVDFR